MSSCLGSAWESTCTSCGTRASPGFALLCRRATRHVHTLYIEPQVRSSRSPRFPLVPPMYFPWTVVTARACRGRPGQARAQASSTPAGYFGAPHCHSQRIGTSPYNRRVACECRQPQQAAVAACGRCELAEWQQVAAWQDSRGRDCACGLRSHGCLFWLGLLPANACTSNNITICKFVRVRVCTSIWRASR